MEPRPTLPPRGVVMVSPARQRIVFGPPGPATQCFGLPSQATHCFGLPSQEIQALFRRAGGRVAHPLDPTYTHQKRPRVDPPPNHGLPVACKNSTPPRSGVGRRTEAVAARGRGCDPTPLTSFDRRPFQPPGCPQQGPLSHSKVHGCRRRGSCVAGEMRVPSITHSIRRRQAVGDISSPGRPTLGSWAVL